MHKLTCTRIDVFIQWYLSYICIAYDIVNESIVYGLTGGGVSVQVLNGTSAHKSRTKCK